MARRQRPARELTRDHLIPALRALPLAGEAGIALLIASVALKATPSHRTARLLGCEVALTEEVPDRTLASVRGRRIGAVVERVARLLPWQPACLAQALAVRLMMRRRGLASQCHLGVSALERAEAHAWVTVNGIIVQGAPVSGYTELARFR
jgi:hypothetical protein